MYLLMFGLLAELALAFFLSKGDYFRPSVIVSGIMFLASVCCTYLSYVWDFKLSMFTIGLLLNSILTIVLLDAITTFFYRPNNSEKQELQFIEVNLFVFVIIIFIGIITIIWHFLYLINSIGLMDSIASMVSQYRKSVVYGTLNNSVPSGLSRLIRINSNLSYIALYILINNCISKKKNRGNLKMFIPIVLFCIDSILWGARGYIFYLIFAAITYTYILLQRHNGWKINTGFKYIKKAIVSLFVFSVSFVFLGNFVGRSNTGSIFYRLSLYFGGGIALLNDYLTKEPVHTDVFGAASFYSLNSFMTRRFGREDLSRYSQFEFRNGNGYVWGNVYTAIRRYYQDFGTVGVFVMVSIFTLFFAIYYTKIRRKKNAIGNTIIDKWVLIYGMLVRSQMLFFFDDRFFSDYFTPSIIVIVLEIIFCVFFVTRLNVTRDKIFIKLKKRGSKYID